MSTFYQDKFRWDGIKNDSGETCPAFGILVITGTEMRGEEFKRPVLIGNKPGTTLYREFVVNGPTPIPAGGYGRCTRGPGACSVLYDEDDGTPANGESWGPKPGQWDAATGLPGITVEGIRNAEKSILLGTLHEITTLLCKATGDLSAGVINSDFAIWKGTIASGADAGFTTLPDIEIEQDIAEDAFFVAHWTGGGWVSLSNPISLEEITVVTAWRVDTSTNKLQYKTRTAEVVNPGDESGWTDAHTGAECAS